jgi:hypothetical protein
MNDASNCGSSVSERAYGASGEIATTVSIIAPRANKLGQGATGLLAEWQNLYVRRTIMVLGMGLKGEGAI